MILFRFILFLLFFASPLFAGAQAANNKLCAIAFYNTENLFDPANDPVKDDDEFTPNGPYRYTYDIYKKKLHNIATAISNIGKDRTGTGAAIIGLAEVENKNVLAALVIQPELKAKGYKYILYDSPDPRGIDVAMLYDPKEFKLITSRPLAVKMEGKATRDVLYVKGILHRDTVYLLINHWPSRREGQKETEWGRKMAAGINRKCIDSLLKQNKNARIIVMGDLNDDPSDVSVSGILKGKSDKAMMQANDLYNPWMAIHGSGIGTLQYKRKWNLFDQILCSRALTIPKAALSYNSAAVYNKDFLQQQGGKFKGSPFRSYRGTYWMNGYSDHYPVVLYLNYTR